MQMSVPTANVDATRQEGMWSLYNALYHSVSESNCVSRTSRGSFGRFSGATGPGAFPLRVGTGGGGSDLAVFPKPVNMNKSYQNL